MEVTNLQKYQQTLNLIFAVIFAGGITRFTSGNFGHSVYRNLGDANIVPMAGTGCKNTITQTHQYISVHYSDSILYSWADILFRAVSSLRILLGIQPIRKWKRFNWHLNLGNEIIAVGRYRQL